MVETEGVIKFDLRFQYSPPANSDALQVLLRWRDVFYRLGAIGQDPDRYGGDAFGNISCRLGNSDSFIISGTQTGKYREARPEHFTRVDRCDIAGNIVVASGPEKPSSEALTHAAIYALNPDIRCVVHGHMAQLWSRAAELKIPCTPAGVSYGTPGMAQAIAGLHLEQGNPQQAVFCMLGHEDGVIAYGPDFAAIEKLLLAMTKRN